MTSENLTAGDLRNLRTGGTGTTPREIFGLVLRLVGLALLFWGVLYLYSPIQAIIQPEESDASTLEYLGYGIGYVLISAYFLRGAPHILRFAYPGGE